ncbi:MAG: hypothetical protein NVS4B12_05190 [Ktedonobacteraceae bacterium]
MGTSMDRPPSDMTLTELAQRCELEMNKFRHKESTDDRYCLEVFYRAIHRDDQDAWTLLYEQYTETVRIWFRRHNSRDTASHFMREDDYVDKTFERFWQAVRKSKPVFESLAGALSYLKLCLSSSMMDELRDHARTNLTTLPDYGQPDDPKFEVEDLYNEGELWEILKEVLRDAKEPRLSRVAYLLFYCNLKPREIVRNLPHEFANEQDVYSLRRNVWDRIKRNKDKIRWKLSDEEK